MKYGLLNIDLEFKLALRTCLVLNVWFTKLYSIQIVKQSVRCENPPNGSYMDGVSVTKPIYGRNV